jgi:hypothetical protein
MAKKSVIGHVNGKHKAAVTRALNQFRTYDSWKSVRPSAKHINDLGDNRVFIENSTVKSVLN